jgi:hypothetical protein
MATTAPGNVATPSAWEAKASRRRTTNARERPRREREQRQLEPRALHVNGLERTRQEVHGAAQ